MLFWFPVKALYPVATSPSQFDYISYIYLLAPVSLAIINPIGFTFMELNKNLSSKKMDMKQVRQCGLSFTGRLHISLRVCPSCQNTLGGWEWRVEELE